VRTKSAAGTFDLGYPVSSLPRHAGLTLTTLTLTPTPNPNPNPNPNPSPTTNPNQVSTLGMRLNEAITGPNATNVHAAR